MRGEIAARGSVRGTVTHEVHVQGNMAMGYGTPGKDGITPHIGENLNWFVGEVDTGIRAVGEDGYTPVKGVDYFDGKDYVLTDADKQEIAGMVEVPEGGTVTDEQIASAVEDYMAETTTGAVIASDEEITETEDKTVYMVLQSANGTIYRLFVTDHGVPVVITEDGEIVWNGTSGGSSGGSGGSGDDSGDGGDSGDSGDVGEQNVIQTGDVLTIISGVSTVQNGDTLTVY